MARPERNNVDYFPFFCDEGKKMYYIEETYGNDGFATFVKILRELAKTEFHYLDLSKPSTMMFLAARCKVTKETLNSIILDLVNLEKFDPELWKENKVIWCQDFVDSIQDAYKRRSNKCITLEGLRVHLHGLCIHKPQKNVLKGNINPQSKVKYTKVNKTKVNKSDDFDSFWMAYDKKSDKKKCQTKWSKIKQEDRDKILLVVKKYVDSTPDAKYRKNPLTWLNGECWNDEIKSLPKKTNPNRLTF